jgi:hypothetical protein
MLNLLFSLVIQNAKNQTLFYILTVYFKQNIFAFNQAEKCNCVENKNTSKMSINIILMYSYLFKSNASIFTYVYISYSDL